MPTIALVDDDRNILTSVSIALEAEGYRIQTYTDGASALDGLKHAPPDLAIVDINTPRKVALGLPRAPPARGAAGPHIEGHRAGAPPLEGLRHAPADLAIFDTNTSGLAGLALLGRL